jgi:MFS family permease
MGGLRVGRQRLFVSGQAVSFVGSEVTAFAMPLIGVVTLDASPVEMGWLTAASMIPHVLSPFFAGPIVDRSNARHVMIVADVLRATVLVSIPVCYVLGLLTLSLLALLAFAVVLFSVLFDSAFFAFVPQLVPPDQLVKLNGRVEGVRSGAQTVGPGVAGWLVGGLGAPITLLVNVGGFLVSAVILGVVKIPSDTRERPSDRAGGVFHNYWHTVGEGFAEVWLDSRLRLLGLGSGAYNLFYAASVTVIAMLVMRTIGLTSTEYGLAVALGCLGGVGAGFKAEAISLRLGVRVALCSGLCVASLCDVLIGLLPQDRTAAFVALVVAEMLGSFGVTVYVVTNASLRQVIVRPELRGRVYSTMRFLNRAVMPIGALLGGFVGSFLSIRVAVLCAGIGQVLTAVVFFACRHALPMSADELDEVACSSQG